VQGAAFDVAPGQHTLRIDFLSTSGQILSDLTQTWTVDVPASGESYFIFRSLPRMDRIPRSKP
jgi:hypothetical protein